MKFSYTIEGDVLKKYDAPILGCDAVATVPDGITEIARSAFYYIRGVDKVVLPDSVMRIGEEAFYMCEGLKEIVMPPKLCELGARAFAHCHSLERIVIPEGVRVIYENTFYKCECLTEVLLPRSLECIESGAFSGCYMLTETHYAGSRSEWEQNVKGGPGRERMVFLGYDEEDKKEIKPEDYTVEDGVLIGYCGSEATVFIPDGVHTIGRESFMGLFRERAMHCLVLSEGVREIASNAFSFEEHLTEIVIPKSLTRIPEDAFDMCCSAEKTIRYCGTCAEWGAIAAEIKIPNVCRVVCTDGEVPVEAAPAE